MTIQEEATYDLSEAALRYAKAGIYAPSKQAAEAEKSVALTHLILCAIALAAVYESPFQS